jgi:hypothetical protein
MRSLLAAAALGVLLGVPAASAAPALGSFATEAQACVPRQATAPGARTGITALAPTVDCRAEGVPAGSTAAPPPRVGTGISGSVRRGPIRPVCVAGVACDAPAAGVLVEIDSGRTAVARLRTGKDGRFLVRATPGMYVVRLVAKRAAPVVVRVRTGVFSRVALTVDTGIR